MATRRKIPIYQGTILAVVSDTHVGSTTAICPPEVEKDDGGSYLASEYQRDLWDKWHIYWDKVEKMAQELKFRVVTAFLGDIVDYDVKSRSLQIWSRNTSTIQRAAMGVLKRPLDLSQAVIMLRGTEAHVGLSACGEEILAHNIQNVRVIAPARKGSAGGDSTNADLTEEEIIQKEAAILTHYYARLEVDGVKFDLAHHAVSGGRLPWTEKNVGNKLAYLVETHYQANGWAVPDVAIRGHRHLYADSGQNFKTFGVIAPCWQLINAFGFRMAGELQPGDIGGLIFACQAGQYEYEKVLFPYSEGSLSWLTI